MRKSLFHSINELNPRNLASGLGVGKIIAVLLTSSVMVLSIISSPNENTREQESLFSEHEEFKDFIRGQDVFFYGFIVPLILSGASIIITCTEAHPKTTQGGLHGSIGLVIAILSTYLLVKITNYYAVLTPECDTSGQMTTPTPKPNPTVTVSTTDGNPVSAMDKCYEDIKASLKYQTSIACGILGVACSVIHAGLAMMVMVINRPN